MKKTLLVVGHGSRLPQANEEFEAFAERFQSYVPEWRVRWSYIELARPLLKEALEDLASEGEEVTLLPLFLFAAGHVKRDIPAAVEEVRQKFPQVAFQIAQPLGVDSRMVKLLSKRLEESLASLGKSATQTVVVMVGRGSSDPDANSDFYKLVRRLEEGSQYAWVIPCFVAITHPQVGVTLGRAVRERPEAILIQPYLFFQGRLVHQIQSEVEAFSLAYPEIVMKVCPPLGEDPLVFELLRERVSQAESKRVALTLED